jgi:hypothetical protein
MRLSRQPQLRLHPSLENTAEALDGNPVGSVDLVSLDGASVQKMTRCANCAIHTAVGGELDSAVGAFGSYVYTVGNGAKLQMLAAGASKPHRLLTVR